MTVTHHERPTAATGSGPGPSPSPQQIPELDHRRSTAVAGGVLVTGGVVWLVAELGLLDLGWRSLLAIAVVIVGLAVLTLGLTGHGTGPLAAVGTIAVVVLAVTVSSPALVLDQGVGDQLVRPTSTAELDSPYGLSMGSLQLDLRDLPARPGTTTIDASVGVGELVVRVPEDVSVVATADVGVGEATLLGDNRGGTGFTHEVTSGPESAQTIELNLAVTIGSIEVRR